MTPAEAQERVIRAGLPAEIRMKEYQRHGATLETVAKRLESIATMRRSAVLTPEAEEAARQESLYWMEVYAATAPKMVAARMAADAAFVELDRVQAEVMEKLRELEHQRKGGGA